MFSWICPKCGREVPPSANECPWCAPAKPADAPPPATAPPPKMPDPPAPEPQTRAALPPSAPPLSRAVSVLDEPPPQPRGLPGWLVMVLASLGIVALLAVLYLYVLPSKKTVAATTPSDAPTQTAANAAAPGAKKTHPYAKFLEITGLRVNEDNKQRAQVQFVVVNHSAADLPQLTMHVTVHSGDKSFFDFPYTVPSLGPFETKDASTAVKTNLKPYEMPDWQFLKADFEITSAPE